MGSQNGAAPLKTNSAAQSFAKVFSSISKEHEKETVLIILILQIIWKKHLPFAKVTLSDLDKNTMTRQL